VSEWTVAEWERGQAVPHLNRIEAMAAIFEVPVVELLIDEGLETALRPTADSYQPTAVGLEGSERPGKGSTHGRS
jgi:transcriptional regulator with XRE-family HTH domain